MGCGPLRNTVTFLILIANFPIKMEDGFYGARNSFPKKKIKGIFYVIRLFLQSLYLRAPDGIKIISVTNEPKKNLWRKITCTDYTGCPRNKGTIFLFEKYGPDPNWPLFRGQKKIWRKITRTENTFQKVVRFTNGGRTKKGV